MPAAVTHSIGTMASSGSQYRSAIRIRRSGRHPSAQIRASRSAVPPAARRHLRLHLVQHALDRRLHRPEEQIRQHAHQDRHRDDRHAARPTRAASGRPGRVLLVLDRPVVDALEHPQHVGRRQDHAGGRERRRSAGSQRNAPSRIRNSPTNPFRPGRPIDDSVMIRNAATSRGIDLLQPAELADQTRVPPVRQHADDQEEPAGADAVVRASGRRRPARPGRSSRRCRARRSPGGSRSSRRPASSCPAAPSPPARRR